jgi:hypothetical protein
VTALLIASNLLVGGVFFLLGNHMRCRSRFNAGVAMGRESERLEHGWRDDPNLSARLPVRHRWSRLDRNKTESRPAPFVPPWLSNHR